MNKGRKKRKFKLIEIGEIDARRGYKRCSVPGLIVQCGTWLYSNKPMLAEADFWRDRHGKLVIRFSSLDYRFHFEGLLASGKQIPEDRLEEFEEYINDVLLEWLCDGIDEVPEAIYEK